MMFGNGPLVLAEPVPPVMKLPRHASYNVKPSGGAGRRKA